MARFRRDRRDVDDGLHVGLLWNLSHARESWLQSDLCDLGSGQACREHQLTLKENPCYTVVGNEKRRRSFAVLWACACGLQLFEIGIANRGTLVAQGDSKSMAITCIRLYFVLLKK